MTGDRPNPLSVVGAGRQRDVEQRALRDVMGQFATGVTVLTAAGEFPHGMTANAVTSVSLEPPLVLCCVAHTARLHKSVIAAGGFGVSVLGAEQEGVARYFANRNRPSGAEQFDSVDWFPGQHTGAPLIAGSLAWLECELSEVYAGGDHSIFLGSVLTASRGGGQVLMFHAGGFHHGVPSARSA